MVRLFQAVCFIMCSSVFAAGSAIDGEQKTATCVACHGVDGNSQVDNWPKIAGQHESYAYEQLLALQLDQSSDRYDPSMYGILQGMSKQDLADLAAFYATQTMSSGAAEEQFVALGEKIYRGGNLGSGVASCAACHGSRGQGNKLAKFPKLAGQNKQYTIDQLKKYQSGVRKTDPNAIMRTITAKMSDDEIEAVSSYVSGLH